MGKLPILQESDTCHGPDGTRLPTWYVGDYSILAIVVNDIEKAVSTLQDKGVSVIDGSGRKKVVFDDPAGLIRIVNLLKNHAIKVSLSDTVDRIYQG